MNTKSNTTRTNSENSTLDPRQQQRSLFVVTSAATLLVALMLIYWPRAAEPVSAVIERSAPPESGLKVVFTQNEAADLKTSKSVEIAWQDIAEEMTEPTDEWLAAFVSDLEVEIRAARRGDRSHLVAIYRGEAPMGVSVLNQLTKNFVEAHKPQGSQDALRELAAAEKAAEESAAVVQLAEERKNAFFLEKTDQIQKESRRETEIATSPSPLLTAPSNPSPLWKELSEKLKKLQVQRAEMLARLHPVHPSVRQLDEQIKRIQGSLGEISPSYPTTDAVIEPVEQQGEGSDTEKESLVSQPTPVDEYRQLQEAHRLAKEAHEQAALTAQLARREVEKHNSIELGVASWAERTEPTRLMHLTLAFIASIVLGLLVAKGGVILDPTIRTPDDAETSLPVPVIGILPATEVSPRPLKIRPPLWCRGVKLAGQLTVVSFLFCFLLLAVLDSGFLIEACKHPLSAFPTAVHRLPELIAG